MSYEPGLHDLERVERVLRTVTENATSALVLMAPDGRGIWWNPAWEAMTGFSTEEIRGQVLHNLIHHTHPDGTPFPLEECPIDRALPDGIHVRGYEDVFIRKDGTFFPVECAATPVWEDGRAVATVIEVRDVSHERRQQQALRESEERLRSALAAGDVGTWRVDLKNGLDVRDAEMNRILGLAPAKSTVPMEDFFGRIHPDDQERAGQAWAKAVSTGGSYDMENRIVRPDGEVRWIRDRGRVVLDADGTPLYATGAAADITERKQTEGALRESEERFRQMADHAPVMIWVTEPDGTCTYLNARWYEFTGQTPEEALGFGWLKAVHADDERFAQEAFLEANANRASFRLEYRLRRHDGTYRWAIDAASPRFSPDGMFLGYIGSVVDIHERKSAEEELGRMYTEAQAARAEAEVASQAKSEFLATMSHELRTPLNAILGYSQLFELGVTGPVTEPQARQIERIRAAGRHLLTLIDDILDLAKVEAGQLAVQREPIEVHSCVRQAVAVVELEAHRQRLTIRHDPAGGDLHAIGDPDRVRQVLVNLLSNAVKFTPSDGRVEVSSACHVTAPIPGAGPWIAIAVTDTGIGIVQEHLDRIFEPFFQANSKLTREHAGTGLGLTISRQLARLMHGDLTVESVPGEGSRFTLWIPAAAGPARTQAAS